MTIKQFLGQLKKLDRAVVKRKLETTRRKHADELRLSLERQERWLVGGVIERYQQIFDWPRDVRDIPVVINSRNRLASLVAIRL